MKAVFGWGLLALGIFCCVVAWHEWEGGMPPLWTLLSNRVETTVTRLAMDDQVGPSGRHHSVPHVGVAWPPGADSSQDVVGLRPKNDLWHMHTPEEYLREHPVGSALTVRDVDGRPMADRTDLRELGYALVASLLALTFIVTGLALLTGLLSRREEAPGS